jgi:tRNA(Ile)-lysidine synthase
LAGELLEFVNLAGVDAGGPCVLAVSGGRDSMLLLQAFREICAAGGLSRSPVVFHLHHGLRDSADADLDFVARAARSADFPFYFARRNAATFARRCGVGLEEAGRQLRYRSLGRLLLRLGGGVVVTAHHADDYLESALIHLIRGGGPAALGTLPLYSKVEGVPVLRPLLGLSRARVTELVGQYAISYTDDPTNAEDRFLRNRLRQGPVAGLLAEGLDPVKMWRNFHPEPRDFRPVLRPGRPDYLAIDRRLVPDLARGLSEIKQLLDLALRRLELSPADRHLLEALRTRWLAAPNFQFTYETADYRIWSDRRGPLWIFRRDAPALSAPRATRLAAEPGTVQWQVRFNGQARRYAASAEEEIVALSPGLRARLADGSRVPVKKILREAGVPEPVRRHLPLLWNRRWNLVTCICLGFWENLRDRRFSLGPKPDRA